MAILGSQPGSWTYAQWFGTGTYNEAATPNYTMPVDGVISAISVYVDSNGGTVNIQPLVWDSGGNLVAVGAIVAVSQGAQAPAGQHWHTVAVSPGVVVKAGTALRFGWRKAYASGSMLFSTGAGSKATLYATTASTLSGSSTPAAGAIGAYVTYTPVSAPSVTTQAASSVGTSSATLNGTVNPNSADTDTYFQWGTTTAYGNTTGSVDRGSGAANVNFGVGISGLSSGVTYHFRAVAVSSEGTSFGADQAFTATAGVPQSPTLVSPLAGAGLNPANAELFDWTYNTGGASGGQTAYRLSVIHSATTYYWNGTNFITALDGTSLLATATTQVTIPASQTQLASWVGSTITWSVQTQDANGLGPFAAYQSLILETPPSAPSGLTPITASTQDLNGTPTFSWTENQTNTPTPPTATAFRRKIGAGAYGYWNGADFSSSSPVWVSIEGPNSSILAPTSFTFPPGSWANGNTYSWSVATQDDGGNGSFAADVTITGAIVGYEIDASSVGGSRFKNVHQSSLHLSDGTFVFLDFNPDVTLEPNQVSLRYSPDHASAPILVSIISSDAFSLNAVAQSMILVVDSADNLFVVGQSSSDIDQLAVQAFLKVAGTYQWTPTPVLYGGGANTVLSGMTLTGFSATWCDTGRFGILFVICDDLLGNHYAILVDAGGVLNGVATLTMTAVQNPSFLGQPYVAAAGSNIDLEVDTFGATSGWAISPDPSGVVVGFWSVTNSGQLAAPSALNGGPQAAGTLLPGTKARVASPEPGVVMAIYPESGSATLLAVSVWSPTALLYGPVAVSSTTPGAGWPPVAAGLSWDVTTATDANGLPCVWLYAWDTAAGHLDDLYRMSITWNGTTLVFGTPVVAFAGVSGGGGTADMTALRLVRDPVDFLHVDWQAYKGDNTFGLFGYFSALPEPPNQPTLLSPLTPTAGLLSGTLQLSWQFLSDMFGDVQTGAYVRRQILNGLYQWWNGTTWTAAQASPTGGAETPVAGLSTAQSVYPNGWAIGSTYAWTVQTIGLTGLLSGYQSAVSVAISNAPPPTPTLTAVYESATNSTQLTFSLAPSDVTSSEGSIEYSDDGGTTWDFVRYATALIFPEVTPTVVVPDSEPTPLFTRLYRAQTWTSFWPLGYSQYAYASVSPPNLAAPWIVDPVDGLTLQLGLKTGTFKGTQIEDMTVQYPTGRQKPLVVFSDLHGQDGTITFVVQNFADEATFQTLMQRQRILLFMTPEPNKWYIRRVNNIDTGRPIPLMTGYREHTLTFVEVDRPPVTTS